MFDPQGHNLTLAAIGTGVMGQGIAQIAARAGVAVRLYESFDGVAQRAHTAMNATFDKLKLLYPKFAQRDPQTADPIARLDREHARGESVIREQQYLLNACELLSTPRREAFELAAKRHLVLHSEHMRLEETVILPAAMKVLDAEEWKEIDAAFACNVDPLNGKYPRDPMYDGLFTRIVTRAPAPIGLGAR